MSNNYPALMAYIEARNALETAAKWCDQLRLDETEAVNGGFADVASDLTRAQADYAAQQQAKGCDGYPYNRSMGEFLGLPIRANDEPPHGYYMASCVMHHFNLGVAQREAARLIAEGRSLKIAIARSKETRKPIRFATFTGAEQIKIQHDTVALNNGKRKGTLRSNWSTETCIQKLVAALQTGNAYGESTQAA
jgi:hypothetical protein